MKDKLEQNDRKFLSESKIIMSYEDTEQFREHFRQAHKNKTKPKHEYVIFTPQIPDGNKCYILTKTTKWEFIFLKEGVMLINWRNEKNFHELVEKYCNQLFGKGTFTYYS